MIEFHLKFEPGRYQLSKAGIRGLIRHWIRTGKQHPGVRVSAKLWGKPSAWKHIHRHMEGRKLGDICPGIVSHYAEPNMTLCDYDEPKAPALARVWEVARALDLTPLAVEYEASRRGWHLAITWDRKFHPAEVVALQLLLGSDPKRETFNLARILKGIGGSKRWNILFSRKIR